MAFHSFRHWLWAQAVYPWDLLWIRHMTHQFSRTDSVVWTLAQAYVPWSEPQLFPYQPSCCSLCSRHWGRGTITHHASSAYSRKWGNNFHQSQWRGQHAWSPFQSLRYQAHRTSRMNAMNTHRAQWTTHRPLSSSDKSYPCGHGSTRHTLRRLVYLFLRSRW